MPILVAISLGEFPLARRAVMLARFSSGFSCLRAMFSTRLIRNASSSLISTTMAGISFSPRLRKAVSRPSPNTSKYRCSSASVVRGVTLIGFLRPISLMLPTMTLNALVFRSRGLSTSILSIGIIRISSWVCFGLMRPSVCGYVRPCRRGSRGSRSDNYRTRWRSVRQAGSWAGRSRDGATGNSPSPLGCPDRDGWRR